jgi:hypothetical protein
LDCLIQGISGISGYRCVIVIDYKRILSEIEELPGDWHGSGPLTDSVLKAIAGYCEEVGAIEYSVETGAGKSTLFFSQISQQHTVFTMNVSDSLSQVKGSSLFNSSSVEIVEGPTQQTLPVYEFNKKIQVALIDGPHGYPFPELEYYYIYQHLDTGAILIIDDINIPSIKNMTEVLKKDEMFECLGTLGKTTFFKRTSAPLFDPLGDAWWEQGYNKPFVNKSNKLESIKARIPKSIFNLIPESLKLLLQKYL